MATTRSYSSPKTTTTTPTYNHNHTHTPTSISSPLASGSKSTLPLPKAIRENRSFVNLARLLGLANGHGDESRDGDDSGDGLDGGIDEEGDEDGDGSEVVDEESLMWDAQTALIAHQPAMAVKYYAMAALPPHRSAPACLALGNLLARGSSLLNHNQNGNPESPSSLIPSHISRGSRSSDQSDKTITSTAARIRGIFFSSPPVTPTVASPTERLQEQQHQRPVAVGWGIPRYGNRAVRNVEGMGLASAWLVLGLGWLVESEEDGPGLASPVGHQPDTEQRQPIPEMEQNTDEDVLVLWTKSRSSRSNASSTDISRAASSLDQRQQSSSPDLSHASSDKTDSTVLKTPYAEDGPSRGEQKERTEYEQLKLMYDLLCPLVALYRHGQIQEHDPVSLPPITPAQLPTCLQPHGDMEKRRNAWQLGAVVASALVKLRILNSGSTLGGKGKGKEGGCGIGSGDRKVENRRQGVLIMANYLLGMTRPDPESYFRRIVHLGQCGLELSDELVEQAASRLDTIMRSTPTTSTLSPTPTSPKGEYPFPRIPSFAAIAGTTNTVSQKRFRGGHSRISSIASNASFMSTLSARILPSMKSTASLASMAESRGVGPVYRHGPDLLPLPTNPNQTLAMDSLRRIRASSARPADVVNSATARPGTGPGSWWPSLSNWGLVSSQSGDVHEGHTERTPILRPTQSAFFPSKSTSSPKPTPTLKHKASGSDTIPSTPATRTKVTDQTRADSKSKSSSKSRSNSRSQIRSTASSSSITETQTTILSPTLKQALPSGHLSPQPQPQLQPPRRRSPLEPSETDSNSINTQIDPELAAAELRSALTKKVVCGVCGIQGVNFPNCRKCEMTFCSRACRVDEKKGGDGKRHVCGAWESRKFLTVPSPPVRSRRKSVSIGQSRPSPMTAKA